MSYTPLVSIIIPTYNRAHLIGETLDSVLAQTYINWECIVIDDGSDDDTDKVMQRYQEQDDRIRYYHRPDEHLPGGNGARNYGFKLSKGDFVNYLDSDDILHFKTLKIKTDFAKKFNSDIIISGHTKELNNLLKGPDVLPQVFKSKKFDVDFIKMRNGILIGDPMFRRELMYKVQFNEQLKRGQDHDFFLRLFKLNNSYCIIKTKLYYCKFTPNSITDLAGNGDKEMIATQIMIHKKMLLHYKNEPEVVFEYERKTRKMYHSLMKKNKKSEVLRYFGFFRKSFHLNYTIFLSFFFYNVIFKKGFDKMKYKVK